MSRSLPDDLAWTTKLAKSREAGAVSPVDQVFHEHGDADRENDPGHDEECYFELHIGHRRNYARRGKSLLRYSSSRMGQGSRHIRGLIERS